MGHAALGGKTTNIGQNFSAYLRFSLDETQFPVGVFGSPNDSLEKKEGRTDGIGKI